MRSLRRLTEPKAVLSLVDESKLAGFASQIAINCKTPSSSPCAVAWKVKVLSSPAGIPSAILGVSGLLLKVAFRLTITG